MKKLEAFFGAVVGLAAAMLFLGFGIRTSVPAPIDAPVYIDDLARIYFAPPCIGGWMAQLESTASYRLGTIYEARALNYRSDDECRESGAFAPEGNSLSGMLLVRLGLIKEEKFWWERPDPAGQ